MQFTWALLDTFDRLTLSQRWSKMKNYYININLFVTVSMKRWTIYICIWKGNTSSGRWMSQQLLHTRNKNDSTKWVTVKSEDRIGNNETVQRLIFCLYTTLFATPDINEIQTKGKTVIYRRGTHLCKYTHTHRNSRTLIDKWVKVNMESSELRQMICTIFKSWQCVCVCVQALMTIRLTGENMHFSSLVWCARSIECNRLLFCVCPVSNSDCFRCSLYG